MRTNDYTVNQELTVVETWQTKFIIVKNYRFLISRHFQAEIIRLSSANSGLSVVLNSHTEEWFI